MPPCQGGRRGFKSRLPLPDMTPPRATGNGGPFSFCRFATPRPRAASPAPGHEPMLPRHAHRVVRRGPGPPLVRVREATGADGSGRAVSGTTARRGREARPPLSHAWRRRPLSRARRELPHARWWNLPDDERRGRVHLPHDARPPIRTRAWPCALTRAPQLAPRIARQGLDGAEVWGRKIGRAFAIH